MRDGDRMIIWPAYFNKGLSKKEGRKLKKELCVENPSIYDIKLAAERLKLEPEISNEKLYPKNKDFKGVVTVLRKKSKLETLKDIAEKLLKS